MDKDPKFIISLALGLAIQAAAIVWWASSLSSSVQHNDFQIQMQLSVEWGLVQCKSRPMVSMVTMGPWTHGFY